MYLYKTHNGFQLTRWTLKFLLYGLVCAVCAQGAEPDLLASSRSAAASRSFAAYAQSFVDIFANTFIGRKLQVIEMGKKREELPAWRGRIDPRTKRSYMAPSIAVNKCNTDRQDCQTSLGSYPYEKYIIDPTGDSSQPVVKIEYPKGTWSPGSPKPGGTLFYLYPYKTDPTSSNNPFSYEGITLEYEVYFPKDFDFVKGGKLPGVAGGDRNGRGCGGGVSASSCFSYRVMWRSDGNGEAYLYADRDKQSSALCSRYPRCAGSQYPCTYCNPSAGVSYGRGTFKFNRGEWNKVQISLTLNDPGEKNGYLNLVFNGKKVLEFNKMMWRSSSDIYIDGIDFSTWFGGSDDTWSPRSDTYTLFRNMKAYRAGPTSQEKGVKRASDLSAVTTQQIVVEEFIEVPESLDGSSPYGEGLATYSHY